MTLLCALCGADNGICFDRRERVPVLLNRTYNTVVAARSAATGALALTGCRQCGFVWNAAFEEKSVAYDGHYENDQGHSTVFRAHMESMAKRVISMLPEDERVSIVEVGAGQGVFLETISEAAGPRLDEASGFDPVWRGKAATGPARVRLFADYFDAKSASRLRHPPNIVVSRHTIEHVARPLDFLTAIRDALPNGTVQLAIETPCVKWIFDTLAIQDFFYEHCSLFTAETLKLALGKAGFEVVSVNHVFGGQYLWAEARTTDSRSEVDWANPCKPDFESWMRRKHDMVAWWRIFLADACAAGPTYVWGAGAKGITFSCMFDQDGKLLTGLVDVNPNKQGTYATMTGCPIVAPAEVRSGSTIIVMNPNYEGEVGSLCRVHGIDARITVFGERTFN